MQQAPEHAPEVEEAIRFWAEALRGDTPRSLALAQESGSKIGSERRANVARLLAARVSLPNEPDEPNGPTAPRWPLSTIKAAILGAKVNEARCIMEGRKTYTDLTTIARNETNLSRSLDELLTPSSIIPEPKAGKIEALSATEENIETLKKHANELIQRIKSADPYRKNNRQAQRQNRLTTTTKNYDAPIYDRAAAEDRARRAAGEADPLCPVCMGGGLSYWSGREEACICRQRQLTEEEREEGRRRAYAEAHAAHDCQCRKLAPGLMVFDGQPLEFNMGINGRPEFCACVTGSGAISAPPQAPEAPAPPQAPEALVQSTPEALAQLGVLPVDIVRLPPRFDLFADWDMRRRFSRGW
ncbi:hypothetical protein KKB55_04335 [Myxococcota bacterium]|nr:hypothetical protein [Myxococcota bacterium]